MGGEISFTTGCSTEGPRRELASNNLSIIYNHIGDVLLRQGDLNDSLRSYRDGLAIADRLAKVDPRNVIWHQDLASSYSNVATVLAQQGEALSALAAIRQARAIIVQLREQSPDYAVFPEELAEFDAEIAKLEQANAPKPGMRQP
jgi:tetratricopeptide (TPR) repeat protein